MRVFRSFYRSLGLFVGASLALPAFAGSPPSLPVITYGPTPPVPALGGSLLMILAVLMVLVVYRLHKAQGRSAAMLTGALLLGALSSAGVGLKLVTDAHALLQTVNLDNSEGGTKELGVGP